MPGVLTERLELLPPSRTICAVAATDGAALSRLLGLAVADGWPPEHNDAGAFSWLDGELSKGAPAEWLLQFVVLREASGSALPLVIGTVGYKGPPDGTGAVEVGYSILPAFQQRGYASEAVRALIARAFADPRVTRVCAETYPELAPSLRVMEKCGLVFVGPGQEPRVVHYELTRADWEARRV